MLDQCVHCTVRGDIDKCKNTPCYQHESWYAIEQQKRIDLLTDALERIRDDYFQLHDADARAMQEDAKNTLLGLTTQTKDG